MDKRGVSHIEIILAFVIFVAVVGFALYFFNPSDSDRLVESSTVYVFREIIQSTSTNVETFTVVMNTSVALPSTVAISFPGIEGKTRVEDYNGIVLDSLKQGNLVNVQGDWSESKIILVMFGEEFDETQGLSGVEEETYYQIGSSNKRDVLSEIRLNELVSSYATDYDLLKGEGGFNLPSRVDFRFRIEFDEGIKLEAQRDIPSGFEVFSESRRVEVLRSDGDIFFADLVVELW